VLQPASSPQSDTNDNDPAFQELNSVFPIELLPQDQNENQVAGQPATFDPNFWKEFENHLAICGEPTSAADSEVPFLAEEHPPESYLTNGVSTTTSSFLSGLDNILSEVSAIGNAQEEIFNHVEAEPMYMDVDDNIVPPPQPETFSNNNLPTPVCAPFSIPVNTDGGMVCASFNVPVNTDGDVPLVVQVATIPSRSQTVIMQGPALAARLSTTQAQCRPVMQASVGSPRVKKVAKTNAERCELYRIRQKTKKKEGDEELRRLEDKNKTLKAKEAALRNKVKRMKEAALRMGLGNYFNFDM